MWHGGGDDETQQPGSCYRRCLTTADEIGASSVAFPAISTGVYGFPRRRAAEIAIDALRSTVTQVERVLLVAFDEETLWLYRELLAWPHA